MLTKSIAILAGITQKEPSKPYFHCGPTRKMNLRYKELVKDKVIKARKKRIITIKHTYITTYLRTIHL